VRLFLPCALLASCLAGCRTANVRVIDATTGAPITGATIYPRYFDMIMGYPVTPQPRKAKRTDSEGEVVFRTCWEFQFIGFNVNGTEHDLGRWPPPKHIVLRVSESDGT
jgi:hypothetical protein